MQRRLRLASWIVLACLPGVAAAALDLRQATMDRLDNGLELIVLEEHSLPVVSVQMLYRTGARDEEYGRTGLAHYLEHMAFRATENFPATQVTTRISGVGGEWHGYTWIDQTTYFETLPKDQLDLALRIEADRLGRLLIPEKEVEAERGAVLAELHGYENDPATVLNDAVVYTSLLAHPYRNNTIGWESDVRAIGRDDLVAFYREHYKAANAVLVVVGDVDTKAVRKRVAELFGKYPASEPTPPPNTPEPPQVGERRVNLEGAGEASYFEIVYRAPAAGSPDFPAFVLMQELLGGSDGVNFDQGLSGAPVRDGSLLKGVADEMETWLPPAAQPYIFAISGSVPAGTDTKEIEDAIEARVAILRDEATSEKRMAVARGRVHAELVFDVETTEDAAHQLAFYAGLNALGPFLALPQAIDGTTAEQVQDIAVRYLQPHQRTIGWYHAGKPVTIAQIAPAPAEDTVTETPPPAPESVKATPPSPPVVAPLPQRRHCHRATCPAEPGRIRARARAFRRGRDRERRVGGSARVEHDLDRRALDLRGDRRRRRDRRRRCGRRKGGHGRDGARRVRSRVAPRARIRGAARHGAAGEGARDRTGARRRGGRPRHRQDAQPARELDRADEGVRTRAHD